MIYLCIACNIGDRLSFVTVEIMGAVKDRGDGSSDLSIRQSNSLTTATYSLSMTEKRLIYLAISQVNNNLTLVGEKLQDYLRNLPYGQYPVEIAHSDFQETFNLGKSNLSRDINAAASKLNAKSVKFHDEDEDNKITGEQGMREISWTTEIHKKPRTGSTILCLNAKLIAIIAKTDSQFTKFLIGEAGKLNSAYAARLYEAIHQWVRSRSSLTLDLNWMFQRWDIPEGYRRLSDFRRRILIPMVAEINALTSINNLEYEEIKVGRSVKMIRFTWSPTAVTKTKIQLARNAIKKLSVRIRPNKSELSALRDKLGSMMSGGEQIPEHVSKLLIGSTSMPWDDLFYWNDFENQSDKDADHIDN